MNKIKFAIQIEPQFGYTYEDIKDITKHAESIGYDALWVSDHFFLNDKAEDTNCLEAWTLLGALAEATDKIRLGVLVTGNNYRYPAILAKIASTVDMISKGRLDFGIGAGWKEIEYNAYGIPFHSVKERIERLEEAIKLIKLLWKEPRANFDGKYYQLKDALSAPKPVQKPYPPIFIGGDGERKTLRYVAKFGDYMNLPFTPMNKIQAKLDALRKHCDDLGRDYNTVGKSYFNQMHVLETEEELDKHIEKMSKRANITKEELKKRLYDHEYPGAWIGLPEQVRDRIQHMIDLGFDYFNIMLPYPDEIEASSKFYELVINKYFR